MRLFVQQLDRGDKKKREQNNFIKLLNTQDIVIFICNVKNIVIFYGDIFFFFFHIVRIFCAKNIRRESFARQFLSCRACLERKNASVNLRRRICKLVNCSRRYFYTRLHSTPGVDREVITNRSHGGKVEHQTLGD